MIKNYLLVALRNLNKQKAYSFINISGLAVGLSLFILAALYTDFNFSYDTFHRDSDRIYCLTRVSNNDRHSTYTPTPMLPAMTAEIPDIKEATRLFPYGRMNVKHGEKKFYENRVWFVDSNFLTFFTFEMISGNPETALSTPNSVVITESTALKYFGDENPIGKELLFDDHINAQVTGVTKDVPLNSSIKYEFLISLETTNWKDNWNTSCTAFLRVPQGTNISQLEELFPAFLDKHIKESPNKPKRLYLYSMVGILFRPQSMGAYCRWNTPIQYYMITGIACALLLVVCINFMNLSTARYVNRAREVGMRKVAGAHRHQLVKQFLGESVLLSLIALPFALLLFLVMRPAFLAFLGPEIELSFRRSPLLLLYLLGVTLLTGILSGSYPAFFLSSFRPVQVLRGKLQSGRKGARGRKILVVSQFALTIVLIIFAIVIKRQFDHLVNTNLGYDRENVTVVPLDNETKERIDPLKKELLLHPQITAVCASVWLPVDWGSGSTVIPEGKDEEDAQRVNAYPVDYDFIETLDMKIVKGRAFSREYNDSSSFIISETMAQHFKWDDPLGKQITRSGNKGKVIGVVKDFHFNHVFMKLAPALLFMRQRNYNFVLIKTASNPDASVLQFIEDTWNKILPDLPFETYTLDYHFRWNFSSTVKGKEVLGLIGIMAVFVSCLGLLGLASYTVERRTKEIGIRKTLGASAPGVVKMLISEFVILIALSNIIAWPIAYFCSNWFLQWAWVYKTRLSIAIFIFAALLSLCTAIISVIFQTVKAAVANPAASLKYE